MDCIFINNADLRLFYSWLLYIFCNASNDFWDSRQGHSKTLCALLNLTHHFQHYCRAVVVCQEVIGYVIIIIITLLICSNPSWQTYDKVKQFLNQ